MTPTALAALETRYEAVAAEIAGLDPTKAGGLPNVGGGAETDHTGYVDRLYRELEQLEQRIIDGRRSVDGSTHIARRGYS
jgi:hypothetical protein